MFFGLLCGWVAGGLRDGEVAGNDAATPTAGTRFVFVSVTGGVPRGLTVVYTLTGATVRRFVYQKITRTHARVRGRRSPHVAHHVPPTPRVGESQLGEFAEERVDGAGAAEGIDGGAGTRHLRCTADREGRGARAHAPLRERGARSHRSPNGHLGKEAAAAPHTRKILNLRPNTSP